MLSRVSTDLTMRTVAQLAAVSPQQASVVIGRLVDLGVVARRDVPPASLVRLDPENLAAQAVMAIAGLRQVGIAHMRQLAADITPPPASLMVFGSFARGEAGPESDIDVLAVRPAGMDSESDEWTESLGLWTDRARRALGNPVNVIEVAAEEIPALLARPGPSVWQDARRDGIAIAGEPLEKLAKAVRPCLAPSPRPGPPG